MGYTVALMVSGEYVGENSGTPGCPGNLSLAETAKRQHPCARRERASSGALCCRFLF